MRTDKSCLSTCAICFIVVLCFCSCSSEKSETAKTADQAGDRMTTVTSTGGGLRESTSLSQTLENGGQEGSKVLSPNKPKVDKAKVRLETVNGVDYLKVVAEGSDKNGNKVSLKFRWTKNDEPAGEGDTISGFRRGDKIFVMITPFDDQGDGLAKSVSAEVKNTPPKIAEHQDINFDGKVWSYQVKATDADGDPLTYSLKSAPHGMTIDPSTGLIKWNVPPDFIGKASFTVSVADGHSGEVSQNLSVNIEPQQKKL